MSLMESGIFLNWKKVSPQKIGQPLGKTDWLRKIKCLSLKLPKSKRIKKVLWEDIKDMECKLKRRDLT